MTKRAVPKKPVINTRMKTNITVFTRARIDAWKEELRKLSILKGNPLVIFSRWTRSNELSANITQGQKFIENLNDTPHILVEQLYTGMNAIVAQFEFGLFDPANKESYLSAVARNNLAEMKAMVQSVDTLLNSRSGYTKDDIRNKYIEICGLLAKLITPNKQQPSVCYFGQNNEYLAYHNNRPVAQAFIKLLNTTHIPFDGNLPVRNGIRSITYYKGKNPWMTQAEFEHMEQEAFNNEYQSLKKALDGFSPAISLDKDYRMMARSIMRTLKESRETSLLSQNDYATRVLQTTHALFLNPTSIVAQKDMFRLANISEGKPNYNKKLKGLLMAFLGTALILGGVLLAVTSAGIATPLSGLIIHSGIAVMTTGIILAVTGVGAAMNSASLFNSGKRTGLSKQMVDLVHVNSLRA